MKAVALGSGVAGVVADGLEAAEPEAGEGAGDPVHATARIAKPSETTRLHRLLNTWRY